MYILSIQHCLESLVCTIKKPLSIDSCHMSTGRVNCFLFSAVTTKCHHPWQGAAIVRQLCKELGRNWGGLDRRSWGQNWKCSGRGIQQSCYCTSTLQQFKHLGAYILSWQSLPCNSCCWAQNSHAVSFCVNSLKMGLLVAAGMFFCRNATESPRRL